jgi:hypothetical protein
MAQIFTNNAITVTVTGKSQASGAVSAGTTLPVDSSGAISKYVRVAATAPACFRFGYGSLPTALATDIQIQPGDAVLLTTNGATHFACIQVAAAGVVQISALENQ